MMSSSNRPRSNRTSRSNNGTPSAEGQQDKDVDGDEGPPKVKAVHYYHNTSFHSHTSIRTPTATAVTWQAPPQKKKGKSDEGGRCEEDEELEEEEDVENKNRRTAATGWIPPSPQKRRKTRNARLEEELPPPPHQGMTLAPAYDDHIDQSFFCYQGLPFASQSHIMAKEGEGEEEEVDNKKVDEEDSEATTVVANNKTNFGLGHFGMKNILKKLASQVLSNDTNGTDTTNNTNKKARRKKRHKKKPKEIEEEDKDGLQTPPRVFRDTSTTPPTCLSPSPISSDGGSNSSSLHHHQKNKQQQQSQMRYTVEYGSDNALNTTTIGGMGGNDDESSPIRTGSLFGQNIAGSMIPEDGDPIPTIEEICIDDSSTSEKGDPIPAIEEKKIINDDSSPTGFELQATYVAKERADNNAALPRGEPPTRRTGKLQDQNIVVGSIIPKRGDPIPTIEEEEVGISDDDDCESVPITSEERDQLVNIHLRQNQLSTTATEICTTTILVGADVVTPPLKNIPYQAAAARGGQVQRNLVVSTVSHNNGKVPSSSSARRRGPGPVDLDETPPDSPEESFAILPPVQDSAVGTGLLSVGPTVATATSRGDDTNVDDNLAMAMDLNDVTIATTLDGSFAFQQHEVKFRNKASTIGQGDGGEKEVEEEDDDGDDSEDDDDVDLDITAPEDGSFVADGEDEDSNDEEDDGSHGTNSDDDESGGDLDSAIGEDESFVPEDEDGFFLAKWAAGPMEYNESFNSILYHSILHQIPPSIRRLGVFGGSEDTDDSVAIPRSLVQDQPGNGGNADGETLDLLKPDDVNTNTDAMNDSFLALPSPKLYSIRRGPLKLGKFSKQKKRYVPPLASQLEGSSPLPPQQEELPPPQTLLPEETLGMVNPDDDNANADSANESFLALPSPKLYSIRRGPLKLGSLPKQKKRYLPRLSSQPKDSTPLPPQQEEVPPPPPQPVKQEKQDQQDQQPTREDMDLRIVSDPNPTHQTTQTRRGTGPVDLDDTIASSKNMSSSTLNRSDWVASSGIEVGEEGSHYFCQKESELRLDDNLSTKDGNVQVVYSGPPQYSGIVEDDGMDDTLAWIKKPNFAAAASIDTESSKESTAKKEALRIPPSGHDSPAHFGNPHPHTNTLVLQHAISRDADAESFDGIDVGKYEQEGSSCAAESLPRSQSEGSPILDPDTLVQTTTVGGSVVELGLVEPKINANWNDLDETMEEAEKMESNKTSADTNPKEVMLQSKNFKDESLKQAPLVHAPVLEPTPRAATVSDSTPAADQHSEAQAATTIISPVTRAKDEANASQKLNASTDAEQKLGANPKVKKICSFEIKPLPLDKRPQRPPPAAFSATQARLSAVWEEPRSRRSEEYTGPVDLDDSIDETSNSDAYQGPVDLDESIDASDSEKESEGSVKGMPVPTTKPTKPTEGCMTHADTTANTSGGQKWLGILGDSDDSQESHSDVYFTTAPTTNKGLASASVSGSAWTEQMHNLSSPPRNKAVPPAVSDSLWTELMQEESEAEIHVCNTKSTAKSSFESPKTEKGWATFPRTPATDPVTPVTAPVTPATDLNSDEASPLSTPRSLQTPRKIPCHPKDTPPVSQQMARATRKEVQQTDWFDFATASEVVTPEKSRDTCVATKSTSEDTVDPSESSNHLPSSRPEASQPKPVIRITVNSDHDGTNPCSVDEAPLGEHDKNNSNKDSSLQKSRIPPWTNDNDSCHGAHDTMDEDNTEYHSSHEEDWSAEKILIDIEAEKSNDSASQYVSLSQAAKLEKCQNAGKQMFRFRQKRTSNDEVNSSSDISNVAAADQVFGLDDSTNERARRGFQRLNSSADSGSMGDLQGTGAGQQELQPPNESLCADPSVEDPEALEELQAFKKLCMQNAMNSKLKMSFVDVSVEDDTITSSAAEDIENAKKKYAGVLSELEKSFSFVLNSSSYNPFRNDSSEQPRDANTMEGQPEISCNASGKPESKSINEESIAAMSVSRVSAEVQHQINRSLRVAAEARENMDATALREEIIKLQATAEALRLAAERAGYFNAENPHGSSASQKASPQHPSISSDSSGNEADDERGFSADGGSVSTLNVSGNSKGEDVNVTSELQIASPELASKPSPLETKDDAAGREQGSSDKGDSSSTPKRNNKKISGTKRIKSLLWPFSRMRGTPRDKNPEDSANTKKKEQESADCSETKPTIKMTFSTDSQATAYDFRKCPKPCPSVCSSSSVPHASTASPQKEAKSSLENEQKKESTAKMKPFADFSQFEKEEQRIQEEQEAKLFKADFSSFDFGNSNEPAPVENNNEGEAMKLADAVDPDSDPSSSREANISNTVVDDSFCETALLAADFQRINPEYPPGSFPSQSDTVNFKSEVEDACSQPISLEDRMLSFLLEGIDEVVNEPDIGHGAPTTIPKTQEDMKLDSAKLSMSDPKKSGTASTPQSDTYGCPSESMSVIRQERLFATDNDMRESPYSTVQAATSKGRYEGYRPSSPQRNATKASHPFEHLVESLVRGAINSDSSGSDPTFTMPSCSSPSTSKDDTHRTSFNYSVDTENKLSSIVVETVGFEEEWSLEQPNSILETHRPKPEVRPLNVSSRSLPLRSKSMHNISVTSTSKSWSGNHRRSKSLRRAKRSSHVPDNSLSRNTSTSFASKSLSMSTDGSMTTFEQSRSMETQSSSFVSTEGTFSAIRDMVGENFPSIFNIREEEPVPIPDPKNVSIPAAPESSVDPESVEPESVECTLENSIPEAPESSVEPESVECTLENFKSSPHLKGTITGKMPASKISPAGVMELPAHSRFDTSTVCLESSGFSSDDDDESDGSYGNAPRSLAPDEDPETYANRLNSAQLSCTYNLKRSQTPNKRHRQQAALCASTPKSQTTQSSEDNLMMQSPANQEDESSSHFGSFGSAMFPNTVNLN